MQNLLAAVGQQIDPTQDLNAILTQMGAGKLSIFAVIWSLLYTLLLSAIMFYTFKKSHAQMAYDHKFNIMLIMLAFISTIIMQLIKQNLAMSLGMLGSLSLVRFRTNAKDPRDLGFVLWAMAIGIASASDGWFLGLLGSLVLGSFLIWTGDNKTTAHTMLLVIRGSRSNIPLLSDIVLDTPGNSRLKAQNLLDDSFELVYEIKLKHAHEQRLAEEIKAVPGVDAVNILAPSAEMA